MRYFLILLVVLVIVVAAVVAARVPAFARVPTAVGGIEGRRHSGRRPSSSSHLIIDTLNLSYWLHGLPPTPALIASTIDQSAPVLRAQYAGQVVYVLKDRDSRFIDEAARRIYQQAAGRNGVAVCIAERYSDPPVGNKPSKEHSSRGRDDFYIAILAARYRCAVLTADTFRDFERFRATLSPFHVIEFSHWRDLPAREFIRPESLQYSRLRKPKTIPPSTYFARIQHSGGVARVQKSFHNTAPCYATLPLQPPQHPRNVPILIPVRQYHRPAKLG